MEETDTASVRVAVNIRGALRVMRRSQEWLAHAANIPPRTLARRLRLAAPIPMSVDQLDAVAAVLEVEPGSLLAAPQDPRHPNG
ncbi:hypothetical protein [Microbacterium arborescens]